MILFLVFVLSAIALDMVTKYIAITIFKISELEIIKNILYFTYVENRGAAFGILQNQKIFFVIMTVAVIGIIIAYILRKKPKNKLLLISLGCICGGGIGNLIDRIRFSYVVDFIDLRIINYPVFNIADCFVVVGAVLLSIYILFLSDKEEKSERDKING